MSLKDNTLICLKYKDYKLKSGLTSSVWKLYITLKNLYKILSSNLLSKKNKSFTI